MKCRTHSSRKVMRRALQGRVQGRTTGTWECLAGAICDIEQSIEKKERICATLRNEVSRSGSPSTLYLTRTVTDT